MSIAYEKDLKTAACLTSISSKGVAAEAWWDRTGLVASLACVVHCLATPFALVLLPAAGSWLASPLVHQFLAIGVIAAAAGSLAPGYWQHRRWSVLVPAVAGMSVVLFAAFGLACCDGSGDAAAMHLAGMPLGSQLSILGGICLIAAHWDNLRNARSCCR